MATAAISSSGVEAASESILERICTQRRADVAAAKLLVSLDEIKRQAAENVFPQIDFPARLRREFEHGKTAVAAEVKRASPSKGDIAPGIDAAAQGLLYAKAGAATISCLTEPTWFKGTLEDMRGIRVAIDALPNRPALLRKDFVVDEYQVYEARVYGADTLLLIVTALPDDELVRQLIDCARSLGMEPLVEVNTADDMRRALLLGARVIGINNRNLHDFNVDLETTGRLISNAELPAGTIIAALSGIFTLADVQYFQRVGAQVVLVGEALMRAPSPYNKIRELQGKRATLVKICGVKDVAMALAVAHAGADMIGLVFAKSKRQVSVEQAREITAALKEFRKGKSGDVKKFEGDSSTAAAWFAGSSSALEHTILESARPLVVGVFANDDLATVESVSNAVGLDVIQLSGTEPFEAALQFKLPVIKALHVSPQSTPEDIVKLLVPGTAVLPLLDTADTHELGGTGRAFDWGVAARVQGGGVPLMLAGGLNADNVARAVLQAQPFAVDVSSGVETADGSAKDIEKVARFVQRAKFPEEFGDAAQ